MAWLIMMMKGVASYDMLWVVACGLLSRDSRIRLLLKFVRMSNAGN
jgi:hypothetical protein